jgi:hypothetical protein
MILRQAKNEKTDEVKKTRKPGQKQRNPPGRKEEG